MTVVKLKHVAEWQQVLAQRGDVEIWDTRGKQVENEGNEKANIYTALNSHYDYGISGGNLFVSQYLKPFK